MEKTTLSQRARLQQLLGAEGSGDRRLSLQLHAMQLFLGDSVTDADFSILRERLLQRLPHTARMILAPANDKALECFAALADQVAECALPGVSSAISSSEECGIAIARLESRL